MNGTADVREEERPCAGRKRPWADADDATAPPARKKPSTGGPRPPPEDGPSNVASSPTRTDGTQTAQDDGDGGWDETYEKLRRYTEQHGHCHVPAHCIVEGVPLGRWVAQQRKDFKDGTVLGRRWDKLNDLGFFATFRSDAVRTEQWNAYYEKLRDYHSHHGDCHVPLHHVVENMKLGEWANRQRKYHKAGKLSDPRRERLDALGFAWRLPTPDEKWHTHYRELQMFQAENGHCNVPQKHPENPKLGAWVMVQRQRHKEGKLSVPRQELLIAMGFKWRAGGGDAGDAKGAAAKWDEKYQKLVRYREQQGHCNVPQSDPSLGKWVDSQRRRYKEGRLIEQRQKLLDEIGFEWRVRSAGKAKASAKGSMSSTSTVQGASSGTSKGNLHDQRWQEKYEQLQDYRNVHGDCNVPQGYEEDPSLGVWVDTQRTRYKTGKLSTQRQELLNAIGFEWRGEAGARQSNKAATKGKSQDVRWNEQYDMIRSFKETHGHCNVPRKCIENGINLGAWVYRQRVCYKNGELKDERRRLLEAMGFDFSLTLLEAIAKRHGMTWDEQCGKLQAFQDEHGHCNVPHAYVVDGFQLGRWAGDQRLHRREGTLPPDRVRRLEGMGFSFRISQEQRWNEQYERLRDFRNEHGHCEVPPKHTVDGFSLGTWFRRQRQCYKDGELTPDRAGRLEEIGFQL